MEYTIQKLALLAGISTRTLRYYDKIDLLSPSYINESGYRIYGEDKVDLLQQILFYKELGLELAQIKEVVCSPSFDRLGALKEHVIQLECQKVQLELLIKNVKKTIQKEEGKLTMTDQEKFEGMKHRLIQENEENYGEEIREKYGAAKVEESNAKFMGLSKEEFSKMQETEQQLLGLLKQAVEEKAVPESSIGKRIANLHKKWLMFTCPSYSKEYHLGLVQMYLQDPRFQSYYDSQTEGCAAFLKEAVEANLG